MCKRFHRLTFTIIMGNLNTYSAFTDDLTMGNLNIYKVFTDELTLARKYDPQQAEKEASGPSILDS